jgi:hypothetical protein
MVPATVPAFLAPRIEALRQTLRAGEYEGALAAARVVSDDLAESHGPLHEYTIHALELVAFCAQLAGYPALATEVCVHTAAAWQRLLPAEHEQIRRQANNSVASWLTVGNALDALRTGMITLALLQSVYGRNHRSTALVAGRLDAISGADRDAARHALRPSGPALLLKPEVVAALSEKPDSGQTLVSVVC